MLSQIKIITIFYYRWQQIKIDHSRTLHHEDSRIWQFRSFYSMYKKDNSHSNNNNT